MKKVGGRSAKAFALRSALFLGCVATVAAVSGQSPRLTPVRPIEAPDRPLPPEDASAGVTHFSFIAYGDTRGQADGRELGADHGLVVDAMLLKIKSLESTPFPVRFIVSSGDAVDRGRDGNAWNVSYTPIVERLTRGAGVPYFAAAGNHDVTGMPAGDRGRLAGLNNMLSAMSNLIPSTTSPRRLNGYPTYAFGFGQVFVIVLDSNIASDPQQLAWVADQLDRLDRSRYTQVIAVFHHPVLSSGPHGADTIEPQTLAIRELYEPLFRRHHVRMTITGHDHLFDHWIERYVDRGIRYRMDDIVTGGGGAPIYAYKGEPDLRAYVASGANRALSIEHLAKPGTTADNPHHFVIIQVDGDRLSLEVIGTGPTAYKPYNGSATIALNDRTS